MVHALFATPHSTKQSLESAFNDLKDKGRTGKANRMGPCTRWSYLCLNPFTESGGIRKLVLTDQDFATATSTDWAAEARNLAHFSGVRAAVLPTDMPSHKELTERWRPAGYQTNRVAAAAVTCCIQAARVDFSEDLLSMAWTGCFLLKNRVYYDKKSRMFVIACGFFKWATIIIPMNGIQAAGETYLWPDPESIQGAVHWKVGNSFDEMEYVPTEVVPPCAMQTRRLYGKCCVCHVTGDHEHIMKPAFRTWLFF